MKLHKNVPRVQVTQEYYDQVKEKQLKLSIEIEEVKERLQIAREMGDLSENGAYKYVKFELGSIGRQLKHLNYILRYGLVTTPSDTSSVTFGCTVTLQKEDGTEMTFKMVSDHESDPSQKKLAVTSPIGTEIMGKSVGDIVQVTTPVATLKLEISSISII